MSTGQVQTMLLKEQWQKGQIQYKYLKWKLKEIQVHICRWGQIAYSFFLRQSQAWWRYAQYSIVYCRSCK